jgi:hypothetical protein
MRNLAVLAIFSAVVLVLVTLVWCVFFAANEYQSGAAIVGGMSASLLLACYGFDLLENE